MSLIPLVIKENRRSFAKVSSSLKVKFGFCVHRSLAAQCIAEIEQKSQ